MEAIPDTSDQTNTSKPASIMILTHAVEIVNADFLSPEKPKKVLIKKH